MKENPYNGNVMIHPLDGHTDPDKNRLKTDTNIELKKAAKNGLVKGSYVSGRLKHKHNNSALNSDNFDYILNS